MTSLPILVVEDDPDLRIAICDTLRAAGFDVREASDGVAAIETVRHEPLGLILSDVNMSPMDGYSVLSNVRRLEFDTPFVMMTAYESVKGAITAIRGGATEYIVKPFEPEELVQCVKKHIRELPQKRQSFVSVDEQSIKMFRLAEKVAKTESTVLIAGESGTGKEVLAKHIHNSSERVRKPFIAVNCAAIPETLLEATMFGYEKGAFTGAHKTTAGKFEEAQNGTLLLDEVSEMDLGLQAKLLRVLQENQLDKIGGNKSINLNVRILATTNRDLPSEVKKGRFREDLFYRLNVFPITTVPLRDRPADIYPLANHIIQNVCQQNSRREPSLSLEARETLESHHWPGNVRELANVIERSLIICEGDVLVSSDIMLDEANVSCDEVAREPDGLMEDMRTHEASRIIDVLREENGRRREAAVRLGISPRTLRYKLAKMREMGIVIPRAAA